MQDFLARDQSPLDVEQWDAIDGAVVAVARRLLVGRRLLPIYGPLGPGLQAIQHDLFSGRTAGAIDMIGEADCDEVLSTERSYLPLPILHKDFMLHWRDLEEATQYNTPIDTGAAAAAAASCARMEDELIFNGRSDLGYPGLTNAPGTCSSPMADWVNMGQAFRDVVAGVEQLSSRGFSGPYAVAVSPRQLVAMNRMFENSGVLEIDQVRKIATTGVFVTPVLPEPSAVVIAPGPENLDLVMGLDMTAAYLEASKMNHHFRVLETLALRIKRPEAICILHSSRERTAE